MLINVNLMIEPKYNAQQLCTKILLRRHVVVSETA